MLGIFSKHSLIGVLFRAIGTQDRRTLHSIVDGMGGVKEIDIQKFYILNFIPKVHF
jgi:hypothetical protein